MIARCATFHEQHWVAVIRGNLVPDRPRTPFVIPKVVRKEK